MTHPLHTLGLSDFGPAFRLHPLYIYGKRRYEVGIHFDQTATETMEDRIQLKGKSSDEFYQKQIQLFHRCLALYAKGATLYRPLPSESFE